MTTPKRSGAAAHVLFIIAGVIFIGTAMGDAGLAGQGATLITGAVLILAGVVGAELRWLRAHLEEQVEPQETDDTPPPKPPDDPVKLGTVEQDGAEWPLYDRAPTRWDAALVGQRWAHDGTLYVCGDCNPPDHSIWMVVGGVVADGDDR